MRMILIGIEVDENDYQLGWARHNANDYQLAYAVSWARARER